MIFSCSGAVVEACGVSMSSPSGETARGAGFGDMEAGPLWGPLADVEEMIAGACAIAALVLAVGAALWLAAHAPVREPAPFGVIEQSGKSDPRPILPQPIRG
jgi:hypothetical protein